jgi:DNA-binding response OmpR family regulator
MGISTTQPKVLIVDDDPLFQEDVSALLGDRFAIENALDSQNAMKLLREKTYDLIILDLAIPAFLAERDEDEGLAIYEWIRKEGITSRVAMVSGKSGLMDRAGTQVNERARFYPKPLDEADLRDIADLASEKP